MRFGLFIPQGWRMDLVGIDPADQWATMNGLVTRADAGETFESVWVYDHFHTVPEPTKEATHEAWTLMAAFAATTSRIRLGQMCTCMAYRNPAYLAKVAATIDIISAGRIEMGIGAGWYEHEWRAYGYGFPGAGMRDGALVYPQPLQKPHIPLWIAGGGEKKTLRIAAQHAQYTNFDGTPEGFAHKSAVLEGHCRDIGRDFDAITRSANYNVVIGRTEAEVEDRMAWIAEHFHRVLPHRVAETVESFRSGPLVGTPEQIVAKLTELRGLGMTYAITYFAEAAYDTSGIELFEREVVPALR